MSQSFDAAAMSNDEFSWSLKGRIRVIDHGITLANQDKFLEYMATNAFTVIAFDPASRLQGHTHLEDLDEFQLVPHGLLGDGQMATLYACIDPAMSGTLEPLGADDLPPSQQKGAQVLTQLPVTTLSLDALDDVTSVDWLLLDAVNDNISVLDSSVQTMAETLLIHAHVPLMRTHHKQAGLVEICEWMQQHGFDCYRFNRIAKYSHLPTDEKSEQHQASQVSAVEMIFTPGKQRLANMPPERLTKLAFLLDTVYNIHDYSYALLSRVDPDKAKQYLGSRGYIDGFDYEPATFTLTAAYSPAPWEPGAIDG